LDRIELPIRTPRLLLRPPRLSDVPALVPLVGDWRVARPTTIPHPYSKEEGEQFVRASARKRRRGTDMALLVTDRMDGRLIGGTGFHQIDWTDRRFELGYWVAPSEWGKGFAPEAAFAVCREAFRTLRMHRIHANVYAFNARSARVLLNLGFRIEGRAREHHRDGRSWVDVLRFGLLSGELRRPD
jgi:[ribosomal protein S5]-alanine N-acetyltransferase